MARATAAEVSAELDGPIPAADVHQAWLDRAHLLVEDRAPAGVSEERLHHIEVLVASHFTYPTVTGATRGTDVKSVSEGEATVAYETMDVAPGGVSSPFWAQALGLAPWLDDAAEEFVLTTL